MKYLKPHLSISDQADQLIKRGLIAKKSDLENRLTDVSYYRLSSYWYPFRRQNPAGGSVPLDDLCSNTSLDLIWDHYIFDRQLRFLIMDAIERIEVSVKTRLVYSLTKTDGAFGYISPAIFDKQFMNKHSKWIARVRECVDRVKTMSPCIKHFFKKYGDNHTDPPMWIAAEAFDYGTMSRLFSYARRGIRQKVVNELGIPAPVLNSWLVCLNVVRNSCAHHEYIWCRAWINKPIIPRHNSLWKSSISDSPSPSTFYRDGTGTVLVMCRHLLRIIAPTSEWHQRVEVLFNRFIGKGIDYSKIGLPVNWLQHDLWK